MMLLRPETSDGQRYEELLAAEGASTAEARWWMPALMHLALARDDLTPAARDALADWTRRRADCFYTVVQEETDDHLSLTASSWPLVDHHGRLRFPISDDPIEFDIERDQLQAFVDSHRARWLELDLLGAEQVSTPIRLGDAFAIRFERPTGAVVRLWSSPLRRSAALVALTLEPPRGVALEDVSSMDLIERSRTSGGGRRPRRRRIASTSDLVVDITWDARQAGKVAQLATFAGVLSSESSAPTVAADAAVATDSPDDERIREGLDRQLRGLEAGLSPDETISLGEDATSPAAGP